MVAVTKKQSKKKRQHQYRWATPDFFPSLIFAHSPLPSLSVQQFLHGIKWVNIQNCMRKVEHTKRESHGEGKNERKEPFLRVPNSFSPIHSFRSSSLIAVPSRFLAVHIEIRRSLPPPNHKWM
uniref:Uncharacterized protein n=1 Tax=Trypanosoma congolense (strain IL3000) TaxID=1068625 RepID=G0UZS9_TRYCI|nr:hypothetical protein, unlikely [Trypanosoma congolense IL3000]